MTNDNTTTKNSSTAGFHDSNSQKDSPESAKATHSATSDLDLLLYIVNVYVIHHSLQIISSLLTLVSLVWGVGDKLLIHILQ